MTNSKSMDPMFDRNVPGTAGKLQAKCAGVAGCGGLGSNAAVALVRAGVGRLILADHDVVELSNLNRQQFYRSDVGKKKVEALAAHLRAIRPDVRLDLVDAELSTDNLRQIFKDADVMVEAFDRAESKKWLIESWCRIFPDRPIVCGNGLAGCGRTGELHVTRAGRIYLCGDGVSDMSMGLCSARVALVAAMEANVAIALLLNDGTEP